MEINVLLGMEKNVDLSRLNSSTGFVVSGIQSDDNLGTVTNYAGDVNGDGVSDLIIGALNSGTEGKPDAGKAYVIFGNKGLIEFNLSKIDGRNGFVVNGGATNSELGADVNAAGDVNGDGIADIIVGSHQGVHNYNAAEGYVIFGKLGGLQPNIDISNLDGTNGFIIQCKDGSSGHVAVSSAGNFNGDRLSDIVIGNGAIEEAYIIFGRASFNKFVNVSELSGDSGFEIYNSRDDTMVGSNLARLGDINEDGLDDIIIGMAPPSGDSTGAAGVLYGSKNNFSSRLDINQGFIITGDGNGGCDSASLGWAVSSAGDFNNDGKIDIVVTADKYNAYECGPGACCYLGAALVVFNSAIIENYNKSIPMDSIPKNNHGFLLEGPQDNSPFGGFARSVYGGKDMTGDGIDDVLVGDVDGNRVIMLSYNNDTDVYEEFFLYNGISNTGKAVAGCDLDDDGVADAIIGGDNQVYVVFGLNSGSSPSSSVNNIGTMVGGAIGGLACVGLLGGLAWYGKAHGWFSGEYEAIN